MANPYLWNRILWYISKRERCEKEIRDYIKRISNSKIQIPKENIRKNPLEIRVNQSDNKTNNEQSIDELIKKLKSLDFLNEDRFARAYIHDSYGLKNKGKNRIKRELTNLRINESTISKYLDEIDNEDEAVKARDFARKKHELIKNLSLETQKRRLFGSLVRRGYQPHLAFKIIDEILKIR
jgi:regulatory protein